MTQNEWLLNFVGLVISVIGSIFLFFGTPRDTKDEPIRETILWNGLITTTKKNRRKRVKNLGGGLIFPESVL